MSPSIVGQVNGEGETHRLPAFPDVLVAVRCDRRDRAVIERRAAALAEAYAAAIARPRAAGVRWVGDGVAVVTISDGTPPSTSWLWGTALRDGGELQRAGDVVAAGEGRSVRGVWVAAGPHAAGLRLVTSAAMTSTLVHARGPRGEAWGTRAFAALALSGAPLRLADERIPEFLRLDYVLGADALLEGARTLEEAAVVDIRADAVSERSWWPRPERLAPGPATTADDLTRVLRDVVPGMLSAPDVRLGLTAGVDSGLVAEAAAAENVAVRTFSFGWPGFPDADGGHSLARALSLSHEFVSAGTSSAEFDDICRFAPWGEGLVNPRSLASGGLRWEENIIWATGHGGEAGRAFYWSSEEHVPSMPPVAAAGAQEAFAGRFAADLERCRGLRPGREEALDVLYATGRMHKWMDRIPPFPALRAIVAPMLEPDVLRVLLDLPGEQRADGSGVRSALGPAAQRARAPSLTSRIGARLRRRRAPAVHFDTRYLPALVNETEERGGHTREVMGDPWWAFMREHSSSHDWAALALWNAVSVDSLAAALPGLNRDLQ